MADTNIPMRKCIGCMKSFPKKNLNRYVTVNGESIRDDEKKLPGRGFYICKDNPECLNKAIKKGKIQDGK